MGLDDLRTLVTVAAFVCFVGIVMWAYSRRRKRDFEDASRLPFTGKDIGDDIAPTNRTEDRP
jgi:cytochrome c oxidase cbb3-type subunit IV